MFQSLPMWSLSTREVLNLRGGVSKPHTASFPPPPRLLRFSIGARLSKWLEAFWLRNNRVTLLNRGRGGCGSGGGVE